MAQNLLEGSSQGVWPSLWAPGVVGLDSITSQYWGVER